MNLVSTAVNLLFEFLPFTTGNSYGEDDDRLGRSICSFKNTPEYTAAGNVVQREDYVKDWIMVTHYGFVGTCVFLMIVFLGLTWTKVRTFQSGPGARIRQLVRKAALYPTIVLLSWLPNLISFCVAEYYFTYRPGEKVYYNHIFLPTRITYCWASLSGFFIAATFFYNSKAARHSWYSYWMSSDEDGSSLVEGDSQSPMSAARVSAKSEVTDERRSSINVLDDDMI